MPACRPSKQALTGPEYHRRQLEFDLVSEARLDRLAGARCSPRDRDVAITSGRFGPSVGGLDSVGDEVKGGSAVHLDWVVAVVSERKPGNGTAGCHPTILSIPILTIHRVSDQTCCGP
jgi:hypothetical protein